MNTKTCGLCKLELPISEFHRRGEKHQSWCKACANKKYKERYADKKSGIRERIVAWTKKRKKEIDVFILDYLKTHPCVKCGESNPIVLEFDHLRDKEMDISKAKRCGWTNERLSAEMNKCQVLCANCHRIKTAEEQGWYKNFM